MFRELLDNPTRLEPGPLQRDVRHRFPSIIQKSHLEQHVPGSPIPNSGKYIVIGVASYSRDELRLLDDLDAAYPEWANASRVGVFDVLDCKDMNDMRRHLPIFMMVAQTPVVALWDNGNLVASQTGLRMTHEVLQSAGFLK
jgi:hypothetical protein